MRKPFFAYAKPKTQISFAVTAKLISAFVFATRIVQSLYFLNPKFQASSHLMWLYSPVCVGPGRKPRRLVFSQRGSNVTCTTDECGRLCTVATRHNTSCKMDNTVFGSIFSQLTMILVCKAKTTISQEIHLILSGPL